MNKSDYTPSDPAEVSVSTEGETSTLSFVRVLAHSPEQVWSALTDPAKLPKWAPYGPDRTLDSVGPAVLKMYDGSSPEQYEIEVLHVTPLQKLEYTWAGTTLLWVLEPIPEGTRLTLHHTVDNPSWITPSAAGWHICLDMADLLMKGKEIGPLVGEAVMEAGWPELAEHYGKALGLPLDPGFMGTGSED